MTSLLHNISYGVSLFVFARFFFFFCCFFLDKQTLKILFPSKFHLKRLKKQEAVGADIKKQKKKKKQKIGQEIIQKESREEKKGGGRGGG